MHTEGLCVQRCAEGLAWLLRGGPAAAKAHACSVRLLPLGLGQILSPGCWGGLTWSQDLGAEQGGRVHGDSSHFPHCLCTPPLYMSPLGASEAGGVAELKQDLGKQKLDLTI